MQPSESLKSLVSMYHIAATLSLKHTENIREKILHRMHVMWPYKLKTETVSFLSTHDKCSSDILIIKSKITNVLKEWKILSFIWE